MLEQIPRLAFLQVSAGLSAAALTAGAPAGQATTPAEQKPPEEPDAFSDRLHDAALFAVSPCSGRLPACAMRATATSPGAPPTAQDGKDVPVLAQDATPAQARDLASALPRPGAGTGDDVLHHLSGGEERPRSAPQPGYCKRRRPEFPQVLTFGHTRGGNHQLWVERFKQLGPIARHNGVLLVVKQHGGETGTGAACAKITREVNDAGIKVNYDAGNVMDYLEGKVNPLTDLEACASEVHSFCIKDHRFFPPPAPGLRPRPGRGRSLSPAAPGRLHRPNHSAVLRKHLRPAHPPPTPRTGIGFSSTVAEVHWPMDSTISTALPRSSRA